MTHSIWISFDGFGLDLDENEKLSETSRGEMRKEKGDDRWGKRGSGVWR